MKKKDWIGLSLALLSLFITQPIWYYLLYQILQRVHASELMWFLYWAYLPASILVSVIAKYFEYGISDTE